MPRIFVGNMSFQTSEDELSALFQTYGKVSSVSIPTDRDTGRARGFAFVDMDDPKEAQEAMSALNGKEVNGRQLRVNEAQAKTERGGGGGGGGNRRGGPGGGGGGRGGRSSGGGGYRDRY
jgi:cold-inducible RNA-binding protein